MKVALYARYSSDQQRAASIDDQLRVCREHCSRQGWTVAREFNDAAISGSSLLRPGLQALIEAALDGAVDVVLAESLDRFSRDQEDTAGLYKRLTFAGVRLATVSEGDIGPLHVGLRGTMNALYLQDLAHKTRRGLRGRVEAGKSGGGVSYGYRVVKALEGQPRGNREIDDEQAAIVRRIFAEYIAGRSPKAIAKSLNADGVAGPTGAAWSPSTINGNHARGTGILNNELYAGRLVWNRLRFVKDPATGKRVSRLNPIADWISVDVPQLRIVDDDAWQAVKARQQGTRQLMNTGGRGNALGRAARPRHLFSGLTRCAVCGGGFVLTARAGHGRLECFNARDRGTCTNTRRLARTELERRILKAMRERLLEQKQFDAFCEAFAARLEERRREHMASAAGSQRELAAVTRQIKAIVDAVKNGFRTESMLEELRSLEARKVELTKSAAARQRFPALHPAMAGEFKRHVQRFAESVERGGEVSEAAVQARAALRAIVTAIVIAPDDGIVLEGNLGAMLDLAAGKPLPPLSVYGVTGVGCGGSIPPTVTSLHLVAA